MTKPKIHDNGTPRSDLEGMYRTSRDIAQRTYQALKKTAPNIRDYPELLQDAEFEHRARLRKIDEVICELDELIGHCEGD